MADTLTAAGLALCIALTGAAAPDVDTCTTAISRASPPCDAWLRCPSSIDYTPDDMTAPEGQCTPIATYDIFDGSKGTMRLCTHPAKLVWLPDGRWAWEFE